MSLFIKLLYPTRYLYMKIYIYKRYHYTTTYTPPLGKEKLVKKIIIIATILYVFIIAHNIAHREWRSHLRNITLEARSADSHTTHLHVI